MRDASDYALSDGKLGLTFGQFDNPMQNSIHKHFIEFSM